MAKFLGLRKSQSKENISRDLFVVTSIQIPFYKPVNKIAQCKFFDNANCVALINTMLVLFVGKGRTI